MIKCKICNEEFKSTISWKHLKRHDTTVAEYKVQYGEVVSEEYKELKRSQCIGENNPNFGKRYKWTDEQRAKKIGKPALNRDITMPDEQKKLLSELALERNRIWRETDTHPNKGSSRTDECKSKIREARKNQIITPEHIQKAINTKLKNGYDLAFFRGRKHSNESKKLISEKSILANKIKTANADIARIGRLAEYGFEITQDHGTSVGIKCKAGHLFSRSKPTLNISKFDIEMCPVCYPPLKGTSYAESDIYLFIVQFTTAIRGDRSIISPKELDIFLPEFNIAIEYHGLYWHSELYKDPNYHKDKLQLCRNKGVRLIQIFEDEWINKQDIVKARLLSFLGGNIKIPARKCSVMKIASPLSNKFINEHHIQGKGRANVHLGLFYDNELISAMTFLNGDISKGVKGWELNRFCTKSGLTIIGGASKLFSYFIKQFNPEIITSYADLRWCSDTPVYEKMGFDRLTDTAPNYWYIKPNEQNRYHRFGLRKPSGCLVSERELRTQEGWIRIYDAGHAKFVWTKKSSQ